MPEPAYKVLGDAIASVMDQAEVTTVALAKELRERGWKPDQSLISKWRQGHQRPHDINIYPDIEAICGARRGTILTLAGYVDEEVDVRAAIRADRDLTPRWRREAESFYEYCLDRSRSADEDTYPDAADSRSANSSTR